MQYHRIIPPPPLAAHVSCLWYAEDFAGSHTFERLLPNGESTIVFDLRGFAPSNRIYNAQNLEDYTDHGPAIFCGARADCFVIETAQQQRVAGIQFHPGGTYSFLSMPATELAHKTWSLNDLWPDEAASLREQLIEACDASTQPAKAAFAILQQALRTRLKTHQRHPAVTFAIGRLTATSEPVQSVADRAGLSTRRLNDLFQHHTGLAPKVFQRIRRFQRVLNQLRQPHLPQHPHQNWARLAADCGYYDQAHFNHDFLLFAGITPGEYARLGIPHRNHVPLA